MGRPQRPVLQGATTDRVIEPVEIEVSRYKNLREVRVPWTPRLVVYGPNAAGKTNLLEALALAFGSRATLWQLAERADRPHAGSIAALLRVGPSQLPPPPAMATGGERPPTADSWAGQLGGFWAAAGAVTGGSWADAWAATNLPRQLVDLLVKAGDRPLVRYRLEAIGDLEEAKEFDRDDAQRNLEYGMSEKRALFPRRYSRCLALEASPPGWLVDIAPALPDAFAPLRRWLADSEASRSPHADLLELPSSNWAPVRLVWLASERTAPEALFDLWDAYDRALPGARGLGLALDRLLLRADRDEDSSDQGRNDSDMDWWVLSIGAAAARNLLGRVMPTVTVEPDDQTPGNLQIVSGGRATPLGARHPFQRLSSGERTWTDIALAHAAARLEQLSDDLQWLSPAVFQLSDERLMNAALKVAELDIEADEPDGHWYPEDIDKVVNRVRADIDDRLAAAFGLDDKPAESRALLAAVFAGLPSHAAVIQPPLVVHVYDEPERHLHPRAQRIVASAMRDEQRPEATAIATHATAFLGQVGWQHVHLSPTPEGAVVTAFDPADLVVSGAVCQQMGLGRGELLGLIRYVLLVEGSNDVALLRIWFGPFLAEAGVLLLPIHGINETAALTELELIDHALDIRLGILADHARTEVLAGQANPPRDLRKEERALLDLRRRRRKRGLDLDLFGLDRADIFAYLDDVLLAAELPGFPGWAVVDRSRKRGETIKDAARRLAGAPVTAAVAKRVATSMADADLAPTGDLPAVIAEVIACAHTGDNLDRPGR